jgi:ribosomal protein L12E/L44/L45/RPP1/RPP2
MIKSRKKLFVLFFMLLATVSIAHAQEDQKMTKQQKKAHEKKEQQKQDERKAEIEGRKRHLKLQDKQTQKRMKKNRKKGTAYVGRKPRFIDKLLAPFR